MGKIIISFIICFGIVFLTTVYKSKVVNLSNKTNFFSLAVFALAAMFAFERISNPDIKILYSLCLVIASGIGRYGTKMTQKKRKPLGGDPEYSNLRQWVYSIMFIFGLLSLIF